MSPVTDDTPATLAPEMMPAAPRDVPDAAPARTSDELEPATGVSIVVCVLNEERHVAEAVQHALTQDHLGPLELVIALGPSRDRTDAIVGELATIDPRIRTVRNPDPRGATPAGLNAAVAQSRYPVVVRIDGHALLPPHYVRTAVETMRRTGADNVGGIMAAEGVTPFEQAVARAMTSRLGVGNASFHTGGEEGPADTVYLGVFRRAAHRPRRRVRRGLPPRPGLGDEPPHPPHRRARCGSSRRCGSPTGPGRGPVTSAASTSTTAAGAASSCADTRGR